MATSPPPPDLDALFEDYVDVVNRALGRARNDFPYDRLLDLAERALGGRDVCVAVYARDPRDPVAWYAVRLRGDRFHRVDVGSVSPNDRVQWRVPVSHLEEVSRDPERFVAEPDRIDLDWLKRRVGLA